MNLINRIVEVYQPDLKLKVKAVEPAGRQVKIYGEIIEAKGNWKQFEGQDFETPFLYKSGFKILK